MIASAPPTLARALPPKGEGKTALVICGALGKEVKDIVDPVSYTHLTLPTIYSV